MRGSEPPDVIVLFRKTLSIPAGFLTLALFASVACGDDEETPYAPLSAACEECLSSADSGRCTLEWQACTELDDCSGAITCSLNAECYTKPSADSCEDEHDCALSPDATDEARGRKQDFETCARSSCTKECGFVAD